MVRFVKLTKKSAVQRFFNDRVLILKFGKFLYGFIIVEVHDQHILPF
jgi:hypothetical protein